MIYNLDNYIGFYHGQKPIFTVQIITIGGKNLCNPGVNVYTIEKIL